MPDERREPSGHQPILDAKAGRIRELEAEADRLRATLEKAETRADRLRAERNNARIAAESVTRELDRVREAARLEATSGQIHYEEVERLDGELTKARAERDEAREDADQLEARWREALDELIRLRAALREAGEAAEELLATLIDRNTSAAIRLAACAHRARALADEGGDQ